MVTPSLAEVRREVERAQLLCQSQGAEASVQLVTSGDGMGPSGSIVAVEGFLGAPSPGATLAKAIQTCAAGVLPDAAARQADQVREMDEYTQRLLIESPSARAKFMNRLDTSSLGELPGQCRDLPRVFRERSDWPFRPAIAFAQCPLAKGL